MDRVYIIKSSGGSYENSWVKNEKAFMNWGMANTVVQELNFELQKRKDAQNKLSEEVNNYDCDGLSCPECKYGILTEREGIASYYDCEGDFDYTLDEQSKYVIETLELIL